MAIVVAACAIGLNLPQLRDAGLRNLGYRELLHGDTAGFSSLVEAQQTSSDHSEFRVGMYAVTGIRRVRCDSG